MLQEATSGLHHITNMVNSVSIKLAVIVPFIQNFCEVMVCCSIVCPEQEYIQRLVGNACYELARDELAEDHPGESRKL